MRQIHKVDELESAETIRKCLQLIVLQIQDPQLGHDDRQVDGV